MADDHCLKNKGTQHHNIHKGTRAAESTLPDKQMCVNNSCNMVIRLIRLWQHFSFIRPLSSRMPKKGPES